MGFTLLNHNSFFLCPSRVPSYPPEPLALHVGPEHGPYTWSPGPHSTLLISLRRASLGQRPIMGYTQQ